jgi:hypothetical protein
MGVRGGHTSRRLDFAKAVAPANPSRFGNRSLITKSEEEKRMRTWERDWKRNRKRSTGP